MELKDIIKEAVVISEHASFREALDLMLTAHTNTLLVVDDEGKLSGEVSVADLFDALIPLSMNGDDAFERLSSDAGFKASVKQAEETPVFDFMSSDYTTIHPDSDLREVAAIAVAHQRGRIPVVDHDERPVGIISRQGLKHVLAEYLHS